MKSVGVGHAKAHLSEILAQIERGAEMIITRRGRPVAKLSPVKAPRKPINFEALDSLLSRQSMAGFSSARLIRRMRDERY